MMTPMFVTTIALALLAGSPIRRYWVSPWVWLLA